MYSYPVSSSRIVNKFRIESQRMLGMTETESVNFSGVFERVCDVHVLTFLRCFFGLCSGSLGDTHE